ncbi:MAG: helix-turn-helix domain-containing protein, partial [Planctomycetota bacterium]
WPGNVRELENVLERAVMFSSGDRIEPDALSGLMAPDDDAQPRRGPMGQMAAAASRGIVSTTPLPGVFRVEPKFDPDTPSFEDDVAPASTENWPTLADVERVHLEKTLAAALHNKSLAAKLLGIDRSVLRRKLQRYGMLDEGDD